MKRLHHIDVTMTVTSYGFVIVVSRTEACHFYCQAVGNVLADDDFLFITSKAAWHVSNTCTCSKKSKRGISVIC